MTEIEYLAYRRELRLKIDEQTRQMNFEQQCKVFKATALLDDMLNGYAPSVAYSRAYHRDNLKAIH